MNNIIMYGSALIVVIIAVIMLIKKMDIKVTLLAMGIVLMYTIIAMGNPIAIKEFESTGLTILDPLKAVIDQFKSTLPAIGFIIPILGGYSVYMTSIGANEVTVHTPARPVKKIKSVYVPVPLVFLIGNVLSLVIPSASNLAIILLATPYPILRQAGMPPLTAAAVIATTTMIMPTPLGGDNVAVVAGPVKYLAFAGMSVTDYVIQHHAMISVPILITMVAVHFFWWKFMNKKNIGKLEDNVEVHEAKAIPEGGLYCFVYTLPSISPILPLVAVYTTRSVIGSNVDISVKIAPLLSSLIAIVCEITRTKDSGKVLRQIEDFLKGMGSSMPIVAPLAAASTSVLGLNSIGLIDALQTIMLDIQGPGMSSILPLIPMGLTILTVLLSGNGIVLLYATIPLMVPLVEAAGISTIAVSIPMGLYGNLICAVPPVTAVVVIVADMIRVNPLDIVKRTSVSMVTGAVIMFVLSMIIFL